MKIKAMFLVCTLVIVESVNAQTAFERAVDYARQTASLNSEFALSVQTAENLRTNWQKLRDELSQVARESLAIQQAGMQQELMAMIAEFNLVSSRQAFEQELSKDDGSLTRSRSREFAILFNGNQQKWITRFGRLTQLNFAKEATAERHRKLLQEFKRLMEEFQQLSAHEPILFRGYVAMADIFGFRSQLELKAILRELRSPDKNNLGASFLKAVTKRRLGDYDQAEADLSQLAQLRTTRHPLFLAAYAETLDANGKPSESRRAFALLDIDSQSPEVYALRGLTEAHDQNWRAATRWWQRALKLGGHEVGLRRNLALALAASNKPSEQREALEHAEFASELSLENEWSVELAHALALNAVQRPQEAIEKAQSAADLASGECHDYCLGALECIQNDQPFEWDFHRF